jgi:hypothetical protein
MIEGFSLSCCQPLMTKMGKGGPPAARRQEVWPLPSSPQAPAHRQRLQQFDNNDVVGTVAEKKKMMKWIGAL